MNRGGYPSDVSDEEWSFAMPYLCLMNPTAPQRTHELRAVFNALRYLVRSGAPWRLVPNDLPPWQVVYRQTQRWLQAGCFEHMAHDLRTLLRMTHGRNSNPTATILDSRTLQGTPESAAHSGYDGYKKKKGSKVHLAVDIRPGDTRDIF
jgi:transposase